MDYYNQYYDSYYDSYFNQSKNGNIFSYSIIFLILGLTLGILGYYLFYNTYLKNKNPIVKIIYQETNNNNVKLLPEDINLDSTEKKNNGVYDAPYGGCIQKRNIYDSDFSRTIYPIDDHEIIYF
jgi:hypothetical protein